MEYKRREVRTHTRHGKMIVCGNCGRLPHKGRPCGIDGTGKTDNTQALLARIKELESKCKRYEKALRKTKKIIEVINSEASSLPYSWQIINEALEEE